jgi:hypothetical protein
MQWPIGFLRLLANSIDIRLKTIECESGQLPLAKQAGRPTKFNNERAEDGTRTRDLLITNQLLYQLSYFGMNAERGGTCHPVAKPQAAAMAACSHSVSEEARQPPAAPKLLRRPCERTS